MVGTTFGNYRIDDKLGSGGMGVVYRATDVNLDRPVAIKTLRSTDDHNPESEARFLREARAASRLQHPAIMTIHHFGVEGETRYIVMEFVEGRTLKRIMSGQPLDLIQLCEIAIQVADGLATAHERGVIHRDMKAENVMVTPRGQVKILDFGLAKLKEPESHEDLSKTTSFETRAGSVLGTVNHMSPEQALAIEIDARTDIFSFGVMLYEMATGKMPFEGPSPQATLARILSQDPAPASRLNMDVPLELEQLISLCLQKDRTCRPDARDVRARLKKIQASLSANRLTASQLRPHGFATGIRVPQSMAGAPRSRSGLPSPIGSAASAYQIAVPARAEAASEADQVLALRKYQALRGLRLGLSLALAVLPLAFLVAFILGSGVVRKEVVEGWALVPLLQAVIAPVMETVNKVVAVRLVVGDLDFMLAVLGVAGIALRHFVLVRVRAAEDRARKQWREASRAA
ncbi:MAG: serine/threonine protein kinase [Acidobacteria bacterium]|nr:serine/threonine protein kinase [Acidobacteriota bacterium]